MRTGRTQFMDIVRLPKQPSFECANFVVGGYAWNVIDNTDSIAISRPKYEEKYEFKRRT